MRPPASSHPDASEGLASKVQAVAKRTPIVVGFSMAGIIISVSAATYVVFTARTSDAPVRASGGRGEAIEGPDDCRTALAMTTTCRGENSGFQECHYHFRAEGLPDPALCAAFLARPGTEPLAPAVTTVTALAVSADGGAAHAGCPENDPGGWQRVACEDYKVDATMVCFLCLDDSRPETARQIVQAFDRSCERGVVLKACNEPLRSAAGL
jgi:hypothetical protein